MNRMLEVKRRLTWLWRLACSRTESVVLGKTPAVWVFDTLHQPDGAVLRQHVVDIAQEQNLQMCAFGPARLKGNDFALSLIRMLRWLPQIVSADFDNTFARLAAATLARHLPLETTRLLLVGSTKGTFARAVTGARPDLKVWEIQHGLLDASYFPMAVERFFARSPRSAALIKRLAPTVLVDHRFDCLKSPAGARVRLEEQEVGRMQCFSKNPGGGCHAGELAHFEAACAEYAQREGLRFSLHLHPRDNFFKLIRRHRSLLPLLWVAWGYGSAPQATRLVVSAYSTALVSNSRAGDLVLNIDIGKPGEVVLHEYDWLPTMTAASLNHSTRNIDVFLRTE